MKARRITDILFAAFLVIMCLCTAVNAVPGMGMKHGHGPMGPGDGQPPADHLLSKAIQDKMAADVLVTLIGDVNKTSENVIAELAESHLMEVLDSYGIDPEAFKTAMDAKVEEAAANAFSCGLITETQKNGITSQINSSETDVDSTDSNADGETEETEETGESTE